MRIKSIPLSLIFLAVFSIGFFSCGKNGSNEKKVLRLAHLLPQNHPVHTTLEKFAEIVKTNSDSKLEVQIFPDGQFGTESDYLKLISENKIEMTKVSSVIFDGIDPRYQAFSMPYLFASREHYYRFLDSEIGTEMLNLNDKSEMVGLCFFDVGSRSFYTQNKPILTPNDLKGLKIRTMNSEGSIELLKYFGATPYPISFKETGTSLAENVIDGAENNIPSFLSSGHYTSCKFYSFDEHTMVPDILVISKNVWATLNQNEKMWLRNAAEEIKPYQREIWKRMETEQIEELKNLGVQVFFPDKKPFLAMADSFYANLSETDAMTPLIKKIKSLGN